LSFRTQTASRISTKGIVDSTPQAPAVTGICLTRLKDHITATNTCTLYLNIEFLLVVVGNLNTHKKELFKKYEKLVLNYFYSKTYDSQLSKDLSAETMSKIMQWKPLFLEYGVYDFAKGGGGADIGPLKQLGTALAGLVPDSQRYFDVHHAASDTFESVSKRELDLGALNMTALIWLVSEYGL
jgi:hypothetical protein